MADTYRVKIQGVREGSDREQVVQKLAALFKREPDAVRSVMNGGVVKQGVDLETAKKYEQVLVQQGCACLIESEKPALALDPKPAPPPPPPPAKAAPAPEPKLAPPPPPPGKAELALNPISIPAPPKPSSAPKAAAAAAAAPAAALTTNPYAPPASTKAPVEALEDDADLESLALGQKLVIYTIIANFAWAAMRGALPPALAGIAALAITIMAFVGVWKISSALGSNIVMKILAIICMFLPLINLVILVMLSIRATKRLKEGGYTVGLLGARR